MLRWRRKLFRSLISFANMAKLINEANKMSNIKKGDKVKMLSGKDRGKSGKVLFVLSKDENLKRVAVEGLNKLKKHQRAKKQGQKGQIVSIERAVSISAVQLICPSCDKPTRVGQKIEGKNKFRVCKKCGANL